MTGSGTPYSPNVLTVTPVGDVLRITLRVYDLEVPAAERDQATSAQDLVFDVETRPSASGRMLAG